MTGYSTWRFKSHSKGSFVSANEHGGNSEIEEDYASSDRSWKARKQGNMKARKHEIISW